ncbi:MAG: hypothetical protein E3J21_23300 [Anaerolineales bacterium]|nr:MAG: hypothetical protein E3J21_23300 [Anaerolineales bacterium]
MLRKVLTLIVVVVVAMLAVVPVISAEELRGEGSLTAQGDGMAILRGRGTVDLSGNGTLWIKDAAGDAVIEVTGLGQKEEFPDGWIQYAGFHGTAHVEGSRIGVILAGVGIELTAEGRGMAQLWGHGSYQSPDGDGEWEITGLGVRVRLAAPPE